MEIRGALENGGRLFEFLPDEFQETVVRFMENLGSYMGEIVSKAAAPTVEIAGNVAKGIPNALVNTVITILSAYIFIAEQERIMEWLRKILPEFILRYIAYLKKDARGNWKLFSHNLDYVRCSNPGHGFLFLNIAIASSWLS